MTAPAQSQEPAPATGSQPEPATYQAEFFVSHADTDTQWAEWIAAELEHAGYGVVVKAWDFRPGDNQLDRTDQALATSRHTVCVLSAAYADSEAAARTGAHGQGLRGKERALIPVRIADCEVPPTLSSIIEINLSGVTDESEARSLLLEGVARQAERVARNGFPGSARPGGSGPASATRAGVTRTSRTRAGGTQTSGAVASEPSASRMVASGAPARFPPAPQDVWELRGHRADPFFTGRDDDLRQVYRAFRSESATASVQAITGLGGQGKTRLAVEYAWRYAQAYDLVWWIRAEDPTTLQGDYAELARELKLPSEQTDQAIAAVRQELRRRDRWLLIFDNAENPDDLFPLLPDRHAGHVLITSRRRDWPRTEGRPLGGMSAEAAVEFLQRRGRVADLAVAGELADALGYLPLALAQAASIIAGGLSAADYLDLLRSQAPELFTEGRADDHEGTIASTWRVSVDRLAYRSLAALALFRLAAFLGPDAIPVSRLAPSADMPQDLFAALSGKLQLAQATGALSEYSLAETGDGFLSIHRMVQAVTRAELGDDEARWATTALAAIASAFPPDVRDPDSWDVCEAVLSHALAVANHTRRLQVAAVPTAELLNCAALYLLERGRAVVAQRVVEHALSVLGRVQTGDLTYLSCCATKAQALLARGQYSAALATCEEVYQARTIALGPDALASLRAGRDLVEALFRVGQYSRATELQDRVVDAFTAALGLDDPETLTALAYQATLLEAAGRYEQARAIEERVVDGRSGLLGLRHPDTMLARANLAVMLRLQGELGRARKIQEEVFQARVRVLGAEHPHTLAARADLAVTLREQGKLGRAREIEEEVVQARSRVLGAEHPSTLNARAELAVTLWAQGELGRAREIEEEVVLAMARVLGAEHPATLAARGNLAVTLRAQGELGRARETQEEVVQLRARDLGAEHPQTLNARGNLAVTLRAQGELGRARETQEEVLQAMVRVVGAEHPSTLSARAELAVTLRAQGELGRAREAQEEVVRARVRVLGAEHPATLTARGNLAVTLGEQGELGRAQEIEEWVVQAKSRVLGDSHPETVVTRNNLAAILAEMPDKAAAAALLAETLEICDRVHGPRHTLTTSTAWQLIDLCGPHEAMKRQVLTLENLSWLSSATPSNLTAEQKTIKNRVKGLLHGGGKGRSRPKKRRK